jgi:hypothetical protein
MQIFRNGTWAPQILLGFLVNTTFLIERKSTPPRALWIVMFEVEVGEKSRKMTLIFLFLSFFLFRSF